MLDFGFRFAVATVAGRVPLYPGPSSAWETRRGLLLTTRSKVDRVLTARTVTPSSVQRWGLVLSRISCCNEWCDVGPATLSVDTLSWALSSPHQPPTTLPIKARPANPSPT